MHCLILNEHYHYRLKMLSVPGIESVGVLRAKRAVDRTVYLLPPMAANCGDLMTMADSGPKPLNIFRPCFIGQGPEQYKKVVTKARVVLAQFNEIE